MAVDGSDDGSVEWLKERRRDDGRIVVLDLPNRGAGATRQAGIEAASGDVVLLLDDDVIAEPGLVGGHLRHHADLEPKVVIGYMPNDWNRLPPVVRWAWPVLARDPLFAGATAALTVLFDAGIRLEHLGLEVHAARAIGSLETMRGVITQTERGGGGASVPTGPGALAGSRPAQRDPA